MTSDLAARGDDVVGQDLATLAAARAAAFNRFSAATAVLDHSGLIVETNEAWQLFARLNGGALASTGTGVNYLDVCDRAAGAGSDVARTVAHGLREIFAGDRTRLDVEYSCPSPIEDGWFRLQACAAPAAEGDGVVVFHEDITSRKLMANVLARRPEDDVAAGLTNRARLLRRLDQELATSRHTGRRVWMMTLAIDVHQDARSANHVGTELLAKVALRANRILRPMDWLHYVDDDELIVVCPGLGDEGAAALALQLRTVMDEPYQIGAVAVEGDVSIGLVVSEADSTAESFLLAAGSALRPDPAGSAAPGGRGIGPAILRALDDEPDAKYSEVVMLLDEAGTIHSASRSVQPMFGIAPGDLIGRSCLALVHPDDRERVYIDLASMTRLGDHVRTRFRIFDRLGSVRWLEEDVTNLVGEPHVGFVVITMRDVHDQVELEEAVQLEAGVLAEDGQAIVASDTSGLVTYWNAAAHGLYGWTAQQVVGHPIPVTLTSTPLFDEAGERVGAIGVSTNISERLRSDEARATLSRIVETTHDAIFSVDAAGLITTWNPGAATLFGHARHEVVGREITSLLAESAVVTLFDRCLRGESIGTTDTAARRADGSTVQIAISIAPIRSTTGEVVGAGAVARDVTERVEGLRTIEEGHRRLAVAQASARLGSFELDLDTGLVTRSVELCRILGIAPTDDSAPALDLVHPDDRRAVEQLIERATAGTDGECTHRIVRADGEVRWVRLRASRAAPPSAIVAGTLLDITDRHEAESLLTHQATHDWLTGLPNSANLHYTLLDALATTDGAPRVAVSVLDLDHFKLINDGYGHVMGGRVLRAVADRLIDGLRPGDVVARTGDDEFVLVRVDVPITEDAWTLADEAAALLARPLHIDGRELRVGASQGVAMSTEGDSPESLLGNADDAMYEAKHVGHGHIVVFDQTSRARSDRRQHVRDALDTALGLGQFNLEYQPILSVSHLDVVGFEALLRWDHPTLGRIPPDEFIPIAESSGLILRIGDWVLDRAMLQLAEWLGDPQVRSDLWMSVNVSLQQLAQPRFADRVLAAVAAAGVPIAAVHLEFTESVLMDRIDHAMRAVAELHKHGVQLSIDDFGTGYSSLSYLSRLTVDAIKIDRSFIRGLGRPGHGTSIVHATIALAHTLGLDVVAVGVELPDQLTLLRELGCAYAQGFLWSPPLTAPAAHTLLIERARPTTAATTTTDAAATAIDGPADDDERPGRGVAPVAGAERRPAGDQANVLQFGSLEIELDARRVWVDGRDADLTKKEFDLLVFLAVHSGQVFSRAVLLREVWDSSPSWQTDSTVTEHIHRLRRRIEVDVARPRLLRTVRGLGYCFGLPTAA